MKNLKDTSQTELLKEFMKNHTVKYRIGLTEMVGAVIGFTDDGVVIRENGQQEHEEYKADKITFIGDEGVQ